MNCNNINELNKILDEAEKVYEYRSGLMHGSISPFDEKLEDIVPIAEDITRNAIFRCLNFFDSIEKSISNAKPKDLESRYEQLENQIFPPINSSIPENS